jgi:hypothetical protein
VSIHVFRGYYFDVGEFQLLGNRFEVRPLAGEVIRLNEALEGRDKGTGRI